MPAVGQLDHYFVALGQTAGRSYQELDPAEGAVLLVFVDHFQVARRADARNVDLWRVFCLPVVELFFPFVEDRDVPCRGVALLPRILEAIKSELDVRRIVQAVTVRQVGRRLVQKATLDLDRPFTICYHAADHIVREGKQVLATFVLKVVIIDN